MKENNNISAGVKTVAAAETKSKKVEVINENEFNAKVSDKSFSDILSTVKVSDWDKTPLKEDQVYHLKNLGGIPICAIEPNRRTHRRALKMLEACKSNGMTTPAILVDAEVVSQWGLPLMDPLSKEIIPKEQAKGKYCLMEGHGRLHAWLIDAVLATEIGSREAFDFHFIYRRYSSSEDFGKAYNSTNADMTRTTNKDRLCIAGVRCSNPLVTESLRKMREDGVIAKASYYWTFSRELTKLEVTDVTYEEENAPKFDENTTDALQQVYDCFKRKFSAPGAEKIFRGVSAAQWAADRIKSQDDKNATAKAICDKFGLMNNDIYTALITASSNKKKNQTRDQVIKSTLDKMMRS